MKKQFKNRIFKSVLLLLSVVLLIVSTVIVVVANTVAYSTTHTLTINFDEYVKSCTVTYEIDQAGNTKTKEVVSGETLNFFDGASVSIRFDVKNGKWPNFTYEDMSNRASQAGTLIQWDSFVADNVVSVSCTNRIYTIHALRTDGTDTNVTGEPMDYFEVDGSVYTVGELTSGSVKYQMNSGNVVELPRVTKTNWIYKGWYIVDNSQSGGIFLEPTVLPNGELGPCYMPESFEMNDYMHAQNGVINVYPLFVPESYDIYREDYVYKDSGDHRQNQLFAYKMPNIPVASWYSALQENYWQDDIAAGGYKSYAGYLLMTDCICEGECDQNCIYAAQKVYNTESDANRNTVYRYYTPILYTLRFDLNGNPDESIIFNNSTDQYLYGNRAEIAIPERVGYTFAGWDVKIYKNGQWISAPALLASTEGDDAGKYLLGTKYAKYEYVEGQYGEASGKWNDFNAIYASEANENGDYEIRLTAKWDPITINVEYKFGVDNAFIINKDYFLQSENTQFKFNQGIVIDNPVRAGWKFIGWTLSYADGTEVPAEDGLSKLNDDQYQIAASIHAKDIILTANWEAETYTVVLDANGDGVPEFTISDVEYGSTSWVSMLPVDLAAPTKEGYSFSGYWSNGQQYIYAVDGKLVAENIAWNIDGGADGATITLNAEWTINQYTITFGEINGLPADESVTIEVIVGNTTYPYTSLPVSISLDYNTTFKVKITILGGFRLVKWNGEEITDYPGITFISGEMTVGAEDIILTAEARPTAPNVGAGQEVDVSLKSETEIQVDFTDADVAQKYDIAISNTNDTSNLDWKHVAIGETQYVFTGLDQGTKYYVFVRLSETDTTLEGIPTFVPLTTNYHFFVQNTENSLKEMITDTDGDCVKVLIQLAIEQIRDLIPESGELPPDFNSSVADIVAAVEQKIAFARFQDGKIAELEAYRDSCVNSGCFRQENLAEIGNLCAIAVADISAASTEEAVNELFSTAMAAMSAVPATYLRDDSITLESLLGLNYGSSIQLSSIQDIKALRRAIADAITQGKITAGSFITIEEATKLLRALDTISAYNFSLANVRVSEGDVFTITLTIPEALIGRTGLQVAYFNQATGMVELLETTRQGNTLIFKASHIADFVILADPTVDLTNVIIALGAILFCQLIAIMFVLIARSKAKKSVMHASVALPMFLTIHYLPVANAELIALGLGFAVLLAQIVLMWLILSSGMIRIFKTKRRESEKKEVTVVVHEDDLRENHHDVINEEPVETAADKVEDAVVDEIVNEVITEVVDAVIDELAEEIIEEATEESVEKASEEEVLDEEAFDQELAEELAAEQAEEYVEEEYASEAYAENAYDEDAYEEVVEDALPEDTEEVYEDEEFIAEEGSQTYYSADDEENVYAYNQEEAERVSDAAQTNKASEETAYDSDPFAGVFGESADQNGDSSNEAGDSGYADPYGEAYEYGDGTDEAYAETEDADREETEGQGTLDSTSYLVIDEEEISDDEEMYRYDE